MKKIILLIALCFTGYYSISQVIDYDTITIERRPLFSKKKKTITFVPKKLAVSYDIGFGTFFYNKKTQEWFNNYSGLAGKLGAYYEKNVFKMNFSGGRVNPKQGIVINGQFIPKNADLRLRWISFVYGREFYINKMLAIEPSIGYMSHSFRVNNEKEPYTESNIADANGATIGTSIKQFIKIEPLGYIDFFINANYNLINFQKVNSDLGKNFIGIEVSIGIKGWVAKRL